MLYLVISLLLQLVITLSIFQPPPLFSTVKDEVFIAQCPHLSNNILNSFVIFLNEIRCLAIE